MNRPDKSTQKRPLGGVMRRVVLPAVLLCAVSSLKAQSGAPVEDGPSAPTPEKAEPPQTPAQDSADGFRVAGYVFKVGGRIKLDIIKDYDAITSEDSFDPRTIVLPETDGANSSIHARETRLFLDIRGPIEGRELRMYVETDFYGSSSTIRLRHAYGTYGGLLGGQTWSTFVDDDNFPNTIDFESPTAFPQIRQAQARYTFTLNDKTSWAVAVEDNKSSIENPDVPGKAEYPSPDLATRIRFRGARGHAFVSAFLGKGRYRPTEGDPDNVTLWGSLLSGRLKTFGSDYVYGQFTFGDGVGRYRGGVTAVPDATGQLRAVGVTASMGGYEHYWSSRATSNVVYSRAQAEDQDYYADTFNKQIDYAALNFIYWFLPNRAWAGVEYLYGQREVFGGDEASANRLQFAVRFNLP
jgi:outer membrane DcaP-like protein